MRLITEKKSKKKRIKKRKIKRIFINNFECIFSITGPWSSGMIGALGASDGSSILPGPIF